MKYQVPFLCAALILTPLSSMARQTTIYGGIGTGIDLWERTYDEDSGRSDDDGDKRQPERLQAAESRPGLARG